MRFVKVAFITAAVLAAAGCVSTNATMLGATTGATAMAPTNPDSIALFRTADQVPGSYKELALLNSSGGSLMTNEKQMFGSMRKEAAKLGANGIILDAITEPSPGVKVAAAIFGVQANRKGKALAVQVDSLPSVPAPAKGTKSAKR